MSIAAYREAKDLFWLVTKGFGANLALKILVSESVIFGVLISVSKILRPETYFHNI